MAPSGPIATQPLRHGRPNDGLIRGFVVMIKAQAFTCQVYSSQVNRAGSCGAAVRLLELSSTSTLIAVLFRHVV